MNTLRVISDEELFFKAIWKGVLVTPCFRVSAFNYLGNCFKSKYFLCNSELIPIKELEEPLTNQSPIFGGSLDLVTSGFITSMKDNNTMAQRACLEVLCTHLTLDKFQDEEHEKRLFEDNQFVNICSSAILLLPRNDISVNRRIYSWIFGVSDFDREYFHKYSKSVLIGAFKALLMENYTDKKDALKIFDIITMILEKISEEETKTVIVEEILVESLRFMSLFHRRKEKEVVEVVLNFISTNQCNSVVWEKLLALVKRLKGEKEAIGSIEMIVEVLEEIYDHDRENSSIVDHLGDMLTELLTLFMTSMDGPIPVLDKILQVSNNLFSKLLNANMISKDTQGEHHLVERIFDQAEQLFEKFSQTLNVRPTVDYEIDNLYQALCNFVLNVYSHRNRYLRSVDRVNRDTEELPKILQNLYSCSLLDNPNISVFSIEMFLNVLSKADYGLDSHLHRYILKENSTYLSAIAKKLWNMLIPEFAPIHFEVTKLLVDLYNLNRIVCNAVVSDSMLSPSIEAKIEGNRRFSLIWRLVDDLNIRNKIFEDGFYLMLDSITSDQSSLRLVGRSWLLSSFSNIPRILDPLFQTLIDKETVRSMFGKHTRVKSTDSSSYLSDSGDFSEKVEINLNSGRKTLFDESRCKYVTTLLRNVLNVSPELFIERAGETQATDEVVLMYDRYILNKPYYLNEENMPSTKLKVDKKDYFSMLAVICVKLMECGITVSDRTQPSSPESPESSIHSVSSEVSSTRTKESCLEECIRTSAASLLKEILIYGRQLSKTTELCIALSECILSHLQIAIHSHDAVFQVELLGILQILMQHLDLYSKKDPVVAVKERSSLSRQVSTANLQNLSVEVAPIHVLVKSSTFLTTLLQGVEYSSKIEVSDSFHSYSLLSYWVDYIISFLTHLGGSLPQVVSAIVPSFCSIIRNNAVSGMDSFRSQAIKTLLVGLKKILDYCILRELPVSAKVATPVAEDSASIMPFRMFTDFVKVFTQNDQQATQSPEVEAQQLMLSELPMILETVTTVWQSLRSPFSVESKTCSTQKRPSSGILQFGTLHTKFATERCILELVDPLIVKYPHQLLASFVILWCNIHPESTYSLQCNDIPIDTHIVDILNNCDNTTPETIVNNLIDVILSFSVAPVTPSVEEGAQNDATIRNATPKEKLRDSVALHFLQYYLKKSCMTENFAQISSKILVLINDTISDKNVDLITISLLIKVSHAFLTRWGTMIQNDKKTKSSLKDAFQKLVEFSINFSFKDITNRRNDLVKDLKRVTSTPSLSNLEYSKECMLRKSIHDKNDPSLNLLKLIRSILNDIISALYNDKESGQAFMVAIMYPLFVIIKNREITNLKRVKQSVKLLSTLPPAWLNMRAFKKEVWDCVSENSFFLCDHKTIKYWLAIFKCTDSDTSLVQELLTRFASTSSLLTSSSTEALLRSRLLKRISFMVFIGSVNDYNSFIPSIVEKIVESLKVNGTPQSNNVLLSSVLLFFRVLITRITTDNLRKWWPMIVTEIMRVFSDKSINDEDALVLIDAMKFLDYATVKIPEEFQIYKWMFISDYSITKSNTDVFFSPYLDQFLITPVTIPDSDIEECKELRLPIDYSELTPNTKSCKIFAAKLSSSKRQKQLFTATSHHPMECDDAALDLLITKDLIELPEEDLIRLKEETVALPSDDPKSDAWVIVNTKE